MGYIPEDELSHYGMPKRSGRYPWGSGEDPYQHSGDFLSRIEELKKKGLGDTEIAKSMGLTTTQYRAQKALAKDERRSVEVATAKGLREKGYSLDQIAKEMGYKNDSSIRSLLNEKSEARMNEAKNIAKILKEQVDTKGMIDVGTGVERELGVSKEKLNQALAMLEVEGYGAYVGGVPQVTNKGQQTNIKVLCPPDIKPREGAKAPKEIYDWDNIHSITDYTSHDGGLTFDKIQRPSSLDSSRIKVRYAEQGGTAKDGVIEIRRGVDDLSLGNSRYAQVRIMVDKTHYLKGMAVYGSNMPDGVDVIFNTNKKQGTPICGPKDNTVLKTIKSDPDNPFGALIKAGGQSYYIDKNGKKQLSPLNKTREEGDWETWADKLPSQFLSKQSHDLAKKQLNLTAADRYAEFDEICSLTNPTVKKALLKSFADDCDAAAVHLKAAALPRQKYQVILPVKSMKDNEVYAPNYKDGETVALIRYPHGGTFEIPVLKVNNKNREARTMLGSTPSDAIGINSKIAQQLSGADFDGDTVMVIPCNSSRSKVRIQAKRPFQELIDFDNKAEYPYREGMKVMKDTQKQMGVISNLITDMTLKGAPDEEVIRAVKHSMVVIDAEKHKLDYKRSEIENGIASLKKKWQGRIESDGRYHEGASTLISKAKSEQSVVKRKGSPIIDPKTGEQSWKTVDDPYYIDKKTGKSKLRTQPSTKMAEAKDARTLSSGHPMEELYADYANSMKALANRARKEMVTTGKIPYSSSAKAAYLNEFNSLNAKLNIALKNAPRERRAQTLANAKMKALRQSNPDMTKEEIKKASQRALAEARVKVGAKKEPVKITSREWAAIQAGAISENRLSQIIDNADIKTLRQLATPRATTTISPAKAGKIAAMRASGHTTAEIAEACGVSTSTVTKYLKGAA